MASPTAAAVGATSISTAASPWTVNLPASIVAGDLLIMYTRTGGTQTIASITGWTFLVDDNTGDASDDNTCILYRWADGSEGATVSVTLSASAKGVALVERITGAENPATQAPEITGPTVTAGANVDPPAITPTGGSKDYLFLLFAGCDGETQTFTVPTNYSTHGGGNIDSGTAGAVTTNCRSAIAFRQLTASSEDPGAWTVAAPATGASAWTIAVHPPAAATFIEAPPIVAMQAVNRSSVY